MNGVYIRALSTASFVADSRPWVDPVAGEWAPGGWHDPDADSATPRARRGPPSDSTMRSLV